MTDRSCRLVEVIQSEDGEQRDFSLDALCKDRSLDELREDCAELEQFRKHCDNLYQRVRALFFLCAIHRFHIPARDGLSPSGAIPYHGYEHLLQRRFEEAIRAFLDAQESDGPSDSISSALAAAYHGLGFQTLADQVRRSVRSVRGNRWMFRAGHPLEHPLRVRSELMEREAPDGPFPLLREKTPVRLDLSHSGWSDIFFLGMDFPEGARVLNMSVDLSVRGGGGDVRPPIETVFRVIDEPVLRLTSVDLGATVDISDLAEVFDYAKDYLGLLKAAVIAAGIVPPGVEGSGESLADLLTRLTAPGHGIEIVSHVRGIPKGSRLAVSTNLLASLIAVCMRATGQAHSMSGPLAENERRIVAARAILGEWLGGSGGGWQDSGGLWPGIKLICGKVADEEDPEFGISRGCLLPEHKVLGDEDVPSSSRQCLRESMVVVHGGMAQNVGPVLEMVTEKYLLRSEAEWKSRLQAIEILDEIHEALSKGDIAAVADATTRHFFGPIQGIVPWATNRFTETVIDRVRERFGEKFLGFCMLGGMAGGGMAFLFDEEVRPAALDAMQEILDQVKQEMEKALPFAMDPVVYDFEINEDGTCCEFISGEGSMLSSSYYTLMVPRLLRSEPQSLSLTRRAEMDRFGQACRVDASLGGVVPALFDRLIPRSEEVDDGELDLRGLLEQHGFDREFHEQIRTDLRSGRIGLSQNRLPSNTTIEDLDPCDFVDTHGGVSEACLEAGSAALAAGEVAVMTLAAGAASRWTQGAGVVKGINPFCKLSGSHRSFLEVHLAKSRQASRCFGSEIPHIVATSLFTHQAIEAELERRDQHGYPGPLFLSPGRSVGLRLVPMVRDLRFQWEELKQQILDQQAQKVRESSQAAWAEWACASGEGSDYSQNIPMQCLHPVGHWFEVPNLLRNGVLMRLLDQRPQLRWLMLHNIDTLGVCVDPGLLGLHITSGAGLTFESIPRRIEDRGGGLARVNGQPRIVEGLALPRERDEFKLSYYSTNTAWIDLDRLLAVIGIARDELADPARVDAAIRSAAARVPTYVTLKEVKKRWGHGQEDVFPVAQFEKLWGDMTAVPEMGSRFMVVPRRRGQQLKEPAQLDGWLRDGSAAYVESICDWG